jgi:toxin FitB
MLRRTDDLIEDAMIAPTAAVHRLTIATRNVRDFESFGVLTLDPFAMKARERSYAT